MLKSLYFAVAGLSLAFAGSTAAQPSETPIEPVKVLVLGAYHFGNPGLDLNNATVDDVTTPQRQRELDALATSLLKFQPNVVAHEGQSAPPYLDEHFSKFTTANLTTDRNEITQIAYRLANKGGIERVYAVDERTGENEPDYFPFGPLQKFAEAQGMMGDLLRIADSGALMSNFEEAQKTQSIPELLMFWNGESNNDDFYWDVLKFGQGEEQPGPELAAYWFLRNAKIFNKLAQNTKPGDRVVIVYGAGHGHWLREIVEQTPGFELEPVMPFLEDAVNKLNLNK